MRHIQSDMREATYWNHQANRMLNTQNITDNSWFRKYIRTRLVNICLKTISLINDQKCDIKILKTDLWNEGIEPYKDVLLILSKILNCNATFIGMDISKIVVKAAHQRTGFAHKINSSIINIPLRDESMDVVLDLSTIDHVSPELRHKVINEYHRVLRPKGILTLIVDSAESLSFRASRTPQIKNLRRAMEKLWDISMPERTKIIRMLLIRKFEILYEGCINILQDLHRLIFSGRKARAFRALFDKESIFRSIHRIELSRASKAFSLFAKQHYFICRRLDSEGSH